MKESRFQVPTPLRAREAAKPSRAMASTNEINAKNLVKKADGFMKPSMLRWKPDFDKAIELYEEAARAYRGSNNFVMAADAGDQNAVSVCVRKKASRFWAIHTKHTPTSE